MAERFAIPVVQFSPRHLSLPCDHPMQLGFNPTPLVAEADAVLVLESDVPWIPSRVSPPAHARVIHIGLDPLFQRYPIRGFLCDLAIPARVSSALNELAHLLESRCDKRRIERRRARIAERHAVLHGQWQALRDSVRGARPIHPAWLSHCIEEVKGDDAIVVNEYTLMQEHCGFRRAGSFFGSSSASGLGWGLGAALGAKLAAPERLVIATLGDGAYLFANPVAGHHASRAPRPADPHHRLQQRDVERGAPRHPRHVPQGAAAKSNHPAFIHLEELPAFEAVCAAAGGYGERVEDPAELPAALGRALDAVTRERRQALLNVICQAPGGAI